MTGIIILAALALFIGVIVFRAANFNPKPQKPAEPMEIDLDGKRAAEDLAKMIRCKTVSHSDEDKMDKTQFDAFKKLLNELYPTVAAASRLSYPSKTGILYRIKGKSGEKRGAVFMSHYDVVPADEAAWEKPAFEGIIEDGYLWGRGTLDTKGTLCGVMEAAEYLLSRGFVPENDIYLAFSGEEELAGQTAPDMVKMFEDEGIALDFVIDEGGAVVDNIFPGVSKPCALVGINEKGIMDARFDITSAGGHASAPPAHTLVGEIADAICKIENNPFPMQITKPVAEMFDTLGRHSHFLYKIIFANLWCFKPVLNMLCKKSGGELNALVRTTVAFTMCGASMASNVLANEAYAVANLRLCGEDTTASAIERLKQTIKNERITVTKLHGTDPCNTSSTDCEQWEKLKSAISQTWPDALVSPYMMIAASDSRHYSRISDRVYRFSCMALTKEERGYIHGNNERIPLGKIADTAKFYVRLMSRF